MAEFPAPLQLRSGGVSVVLDASDGLMPRVVHWGADLGERSDAELRDLALAALAEPVANTVDTFRPAGLVAEHALGWAGEPGLRGDRHGRDWSPLFRLIGLETGGGDDAPRVRLHLEDDVARLSVDLVLELCPAGLLGMRGTVRNTGDTPYRLHGLDLSLPVPDRATELLDLTGRHTREAQPQRTPFTLGRHAREGRRGRTGTDATQLLWAGVPGFGFRSGEVWGMHVAWSGNHRTAAERVPLGGPVLTGGELLLPGEVTLAPRDDYETPWVYGTWGVGLDEASARLHQNLRVRSHHPRTPRPVVLNTWEAVYYDHDLDVLSDLAVRGARVGAERFVLDDGWFLGRRDDHAGLGDWVVDPQVWPRGLTPLIDRVHELGMDFGLWVEPEMVSLDSDLARAHPDWVLSTGGRTPLASRHQQVLDLGNDDAYAHVLGALDALLGENAIASLKWDHNRDLVDAGGPDGRPRVHRQTLAAYRLMDELRARHPGLEIEACSSGGGRVDLAVLERTDRVWASDCIDPGERQVIQRWTGLLVPPELIGSHVGASRAHTTGRTHDLSFRAGTCLLSSLGIEWDLRLAGEAELTELARWIDLHKSLRPLIATGQVVRADTPDDATWVHGIVSADRAHAVYTLVALDAPLTTHPGRVCLPGLAPDAAYHVRPLPPGDDVAGPAYGPLQWWTTGVTLSGAALQHAGLQMPVLHPEHLVLVEARRC